jgi:Flp pilus assembly pilin Flp
MMMRIRRAGLFRDEGGVALVEFALLAPVLALLCVGAIDFGLAFASQLQLAAAVDEGAQYAFLTGPAVQASSVQTVVQTATPLPGITAAVSYSATSCYCPTGTPPALATQTCGMACPDGTMPGKFLSISAQYTYAPIFPSYALIANPTFSETVTVRVQ